MHRGSNRRVIHRLRTFLLAAIFGACAGAAAHAADPVRIEAVGTAFRVTLPDGTVREGRDLAGAVLTFRINDAPMRIRIASIVPDPEDKTGRVLLHDFRIADTDAPLCNAAPDGTRLGFPLAGRTAADGTFVAAAPGDFELVCTAGGQGKCVRFGYHPWTTAPNGKPMRDYFNACGRLLRADYCGDGQGWTRDGTLVDIWDDLGLQTSDGGAALTFEAGWTPGGAACVAHSRIPANITLDRLKTYCPRLAALPTCDEASARAAGALLFNRSK